jgi:hypothetical protein
MYVYSYNGGGFGNAVFSHLAAILLAELFGLQKKKITEFSEIDSFSRSCYIKVNDDYFMQIMDAYIHNNRNILDTSKSHFLIGFYQHDYYFVKYKDIIVKYIQNNPEEYIFADHHREPYQLGDIINTRSTPIYDIAVHIRLGDFISLGWTMHPDSIIKILLKISANTRSTCFVVKNPSTEIEEKYIQYIQRAIPNAVLETHGDPIDDYNILRNAKNLVCSCSTLSWIASLFGKEEQTVYFPNYQSRWNHEKFRNPHGRTILYDFKYCNETEMQSILDH